MAGSNTPTDADSEDKDTQLEHLAELVNGRVELENVPHHGFRVALNHIFSKKGKPFTTPRLHQLPSFIGLSLRLVSCSTVGEIFMTRQSKLFGSCVIFFFKKILVLLHLSKCHVGNIP